MAKSLYLVLIGCTPQGRLTEQHDLFIGIAEALKDLVPDMKSSWPEAKGKIHIDAWRTVQFVDGYSIAVFPRDSKTGQINELQLFLLNLGGYKPGEFEEYHYKVLVVAKTKSEAIKKAKRTTFYKHCGFKGAESHIDDQYGIDVDDIHNIGELLAEKYKSEYQLVITPSDLQHEDELHIGYIKINSLK